MSQESPWGPLDLEPGASRDLYIGTLHLDMRRTPDEVWLRRDARPGVPVPSDEWQRWALPGDASLSLRPAVPDRLLVVSHEHPFRLPARMQAHVYVRVPLFVQVVASGSGLGEIVLSDEPSIVLSDTWWGTFEDGELAYWLNTTARAGVSDDLFLPHVGMCPLQLENASSEALPVDRFALRAQHLSIFTRNGRNWTDEVHVRYHASVEGSEIDFGGRPPPEVPGAATLASPRVPLRRGLQARTFQRLRLSLGGGV